MTFLEAAIEVLKREGKPLPTRKLAELAVKHNLLSVVGRDPEGTMQVRLEDALAKDGSRSDLFLVKAGVYGLREYPERPYPAKAEKAEPVRAARAAEKAVDKEEQPAAEAEEAAGDGKKPARRRRGRRGRGGKAEKAGAPETAAAESEPAEAVNEVDAVESAEPAEEAAPAKTASNGVVAEATAGERPARRRSRRGGRGRRRGGAEDKAAEPEAEAAAESRGPGGEGSVESTIEAADAASSGEPRLSDSFSRGGAEQDEVTHPGAPIGDEELLEGSDGSLSDEIEEEFDLPGGPVLAPSMGAEDVTRTDDEREVRAEILGRGGEDRGRRRRHERGRDRHPRGGARDARPAGRDAGAAPARDAGRHEGPRQEGPRQEGPRHEGQRHEGQRHEGPRRDGQRQEGQRQDGPRQEGQRHEGIRHEHGRNDGRPQHEREPREGGARANGLLEAAIEVMRAEGGRPMHVRHLSDLLVKRKSADGRGGSNEIVRQLRVLLVREQREREAEGLRARVRPAGGGQWALVERRLDSELVPLERELAERAARLTRATVAAMRRRIGRLPPPAFEALGRALVERLGVTSLELVRRGDGVVYYGGNRQIGSGGARLLIALRAGESEVNRRAVGELRAGLSARGFDQGLLLAGGRAGEEALAELKAGAGVTAYDGLAMAELCARQGLGVRRLYLPVDYLDVDLFSELTES